jgi:hypothetical protein
MIDPLGLLRVFVLNQQKISFDVESRELHFEEINLRLPADTATAWKHGSKAGTYYNLAAIWFYSEMK